MRVIYEDEYGNVIFTDISEIVPMLGESVVFGEEIYRVKTREFYPADKTVAITLTQNIIRTTQQSDTSSAKDIHVAMEALTKKQEETEKKTKNLSEQLVSVRTHIRNNFNKAKKDQSQ